MPRGADEDGSVGITTALAVINILMVAAAALVAVADLSVTAARARATADAAALAGAAMSPLVGTGGAPDAAARKVAAANGGVVVDSDLRSWPLRYGVTVEVPPRTEWVRRFVGSLREASVAGVRPRVAEAEP